MKISSLCAFLAFSILPATAQVPVTNPVTNLAPLPATANAPTMATVTPFITGLKEPQGMVLDADKNLLVCDYSAGEITRFSPDGKALGRFAEGLKGPSAIVSAAGQIFVSERKANRVLRFRGGKMDVVLAGIPEPIGLVVEASFRPNQSIEMVREGKNIFFTLSVVSHTTSKIYRLGNLGAITADKIPLLSVLPLIDSLFQSRSDANQPSLIYSAPSTDGARYGFRWLVRDGTAFFLSDEVGEKILMLTENGRVATFSSGISDPSGIAIGPDKMVYVANEGDGGQLIRLNSEGEKTVVAEKLGRPRGILFLDAKTVLVSNRDGNIWKIVLP